MSNVIPFNRPQPAPAANVELTINTSANKIADSLVSNLLYEGYQLEPDDVKDVAMLMETIKSFVSKKHKVEHPFQTLSDRLFGEPDLTADNNIEIRFKYQKCYEI